MLRFSPMTPPATSTIRRLPPETASRIAAGEVIERPLSALKELIENALDAGARSIEIRVERSLDQLFQVADDGGGISSADLDVALERHATSKIASLEDLDRLTTLGFRGEALPSIAAVSRLRIVSRDRDAGEGSMLRAEGGRIVEHATTARAPGTTVEVRDLFFNTPARRKFLKSPAGELRAAMRLIEAYALSFPEVAFRLTVDVRERCAWPAAARPGLAGLVERAAALWGARHAEQRLVVESNRDGMELLALLGLPEHARSSREGQIVLVNRRWVQSPLISQALRQAYGNLLPAGRFPVFALVITLSPERLDVNVHPTKREVRFAEEDRVFSWVAGSCAQRLAGLHPPLAVVYGSAAEPPWAHRVAEHPEQQTHLALAPDDPAGPGTEAAPAGTRAAAAPRGPEADFWQLHRTYVLAQVRGGLVIVDQHAAHERILFEQSMARLTGERGPSQQLLFPVLVDLTQDQFDLLLELGPSLRQLGWDLSPLGPPTVVIQGVPAGVAEDRPAALLQDVLDGVAEDTGRTAGEEVTQRLARSFACHAATRAGDPLDQEEMRSLLDRLFATSLPSGDPHGRPTYVRLELDELHRRFGRS